MLSVRNMIAILLTIAILMGVFFVATLYYPTNKRAKRIARSRAMLEAQIEAPTPQGAKVGTGEDIVDVMGMDVNFFKSRNLSPMKGIPDLLEQINRMGNQMNIRFVAVKPLENEDAPGYRKYPFLIETRATYTELVNFVHRIENGLRLSLNDLRMESDEKDPAIHRLQFTLNIMELKDELSAGQGGLGGNANNQPEKIPLVAVHRDPFGAKKPV
ncbi:MAG: type 4a pilus biogenesis protein PilO, partial [Proteobacteria bacterium]|nr:type 4a pilus biogenesis protein PilO [Pseudomonadota bacterium]NIS70929.1 type 4a pilus biogenesis protein PilO [Pseudomonadota bacterium]